MAKSLYELNQEALYAPQNMGFASSAPVQRRPDYNLGNDFGDLNYQTPEYDYSLYGAPQQQQQPQGSPLGMAANIGVQQGVNSLMSGGGAAASGGTGLGSTVAADSAASTGYTLNSGAAASSSPGMFSLSGIGSAGNVILPAVGAYGAYDLYKRQSGAPRGNYGRGIGQGAASGAAIGSYFGPWGAAIGAGVGGLAGGIGAATGSGKSKNQMKRDEIRKSLIDMGVLDDKYNLTLADGSKFDAGKDGGFRLKGADGTERHITTTDGKAKTTGAANTYAKTILGILGQNDKDFTGIFTNALQSTGDDENKVKSNAKALMSKVGISDGGQALTTLYDMAQSGAITKDDYNKSKQDIIGLYGDKDANGKPIRPYRQYGKYKVPVYEMFF